MNQLEKLLENLPECKLCRAADLKIKLKLCCAKTIKVLKPSVRRKLTKKRRSE